MGDLLRDSEVAQAFDLRHLNVRFSNSFADIEAIQAKKLWLLIKYNTLLCWNLVWWRPKVVIICPAFGKLAFAKDAGFTLLAGWVFRRRVIWWVHPTGMDRLLLSAGRVGRAVIRWVSSLVHRVIVVGHAQRHEFDGLVESERIGTIHNGVRADNYSLDRFANRSVVTVTFVSNLEVTKGWQDLLEAATIICRRRGGVSFEFHGNPGRDAPLQTVNQAFARAGFPDRIRYCGPAYGPEKHAALDAADIFCFPTYLDSFGLVNLEAMNAGLPIVSTAYSSIPEVVTDGEGGFLVEPRDVATLVGSLERLIENSALRRTMGAYNQARFYDKFSEVAFSRRWLELLRELSPT